MSGVSSIELACNMLTSTSMFADAGRSLDQESAPDRTHARLCRIHWAGVRQKRCSQQCTVDGESCAHTVCICWCRLVPPSFDPPHRRCVDFAQKALCRPDPRLASTRPRCSLSSSPLARTLPTPSGRSRCASLRSSRAQPRTTTRSTVSLPPSCQRAPPPRTSLMALLASPASRLLVPSMRRTILPRSTQTWELSPTGSSTMPTTRTSQPLRTPSRHPLPRADTTTSLRRRAGMPRGPMGSETSIFGGDGWLLRR